MYTLFFIKSKIKPKSTNNLFKFFDVINGKYWHWSRNGGGDTSSALPYSLNIPVSGISFRKKNSVKIMSRS